MYEIICAYSKKVSKIIHSGGETDLFLNLVHVQIYWSGLLPRMATSVSICPIPVRNEISLKCPFRRKER